MQYLAKWGPKGFLVSPNKVVPFDGFSTSFELKKDSKNDTSGTAPTNTRGLELVKMSFETTYLIAAGVDPRAQIEEWKSLIGNSYPLILGGKKFGPDKMMLSSVSASDFLFSNTGKMLRAKVALSFQEDANGATSTLKSSNKSSGGTSKKSKAKSTYEQTVAEIKSAKNATASSADKAAKKPNGGGA